jgi:hypothetical protein
MGRELYGNVVGRKIASVNTGADLSAKGPLAWKSWAFLLWNWSNDISPDYP